jgi:hypothetical protein
MKDRGLWGKGYLAGGIVLLPVVGPMLVMLLGVYGVVLVAIWIVILLLSIKMMK